MIILNKNQIIILVVILTISLFAVLFIPFLIARDYALTYHEYNIIDYLDSGAFFAQFMFNIVLVISIVILFIIILYLLRESERTSKSVNAQ